MNNKTEEMSELVRDVITDLLSFSPECEGQVGLDIENALKQERPRLYAQVQSLLSSLPPSGPTPGWISVKDRLPAFGERVLAYSPANKHQGERYFVTALHVYSGKKDMIWLNEDINEWATHWTTLIFPPSGAASEATFQAWLDKQVEPNDEDYPSPEAIGFAEAAWNAGKASAKEKL